MPNARETGYYRYRLDKGSFERLLAHIADLDAAERAGVVLNAWALMLLEKGTLAEVGSVIAKLDLGKEPRVVVQAVTTVLEEMARVLVDESNEAAFAKYVGARLAPLAKKLGAATRPSDGDDARLMRGAVLATLIDYGPPGSAPDLEPVAKAYLADAKKGDPDVGPLALRVVARKGSPSAALIDAKRLSAAVLPDERVALTAALASRQKPEALKETMDFLAKGTIRAGDYRHVRNAMMRRRDARKVFHQAMRDNFDALTGKLGGAAGLTGTLREVCDATELGALAGFFDQRLAKLEGAQRGYDEGVAEAKRCIATKERERTNSAALFAR